MIVGEGGVSPEYFLNRMQWWEVQHYLIGLRRRYHSGWEEVRSLQWWLACMFHDKKQGAAPNHPQDLYKFIWEDEPPESNPMSEADIAEMQDMINKFKW